MKRSPIARSTTRIRPRAKARPGRLKGADLAQLRLDCFERDGYRCRAQVGEGWTSRVCGMEVFAELDYREPQSAHMAHVQAKRRGGDNLGNVETNCGDCHRAHHAGGKPCPSKNQEPA